MTGRIDPDRKSASRGGIKEEDPRCSSGRSEDLILPKKNEKNLDDIPDYVKNEMNFIFVEHIQEVLI